MMDSAKHASDGPDRTLRDARLLAIRIWSVVGVFIVGFMLLNVFDVLAPVIEFIAVGSLIAFVESPIVNFLEHKGVPRTVGSLVGLVCVVAGVVCVVLVIAPALAEQAMEILVRMPAQLRGLGDWVSQLVRDLQSLSKSSWGSQLVSNLQTLENAATSYVTTLAGDIGKGMFPLLSDFASQIFILFLSLVLGYWLACDYPRIHKEIGTIVGGEREVTYRFMVAIMSRSVGGYMRGMVITSFVNGALAGVGFALAGHPYAALMGVLTGLMHLIPVLGSWISAFAATLLALFYSPVLAFWTIIVCMVAQNVTDNVVSPKVMQSSVQIHPAMNLAALVVGSTLMGAIGMVVAIPLCAALKGLFVFYFEKSTGRALVSYDGAIFQGTPYRDEHGNPVPAFDALGDDTFVQESELIPKDVAPTGSAVPRPDLENPWSKLQFLHRNSEADAKGEQKPADTAPDDKTSRD